MREDFNPVEKLLANQNDLCFNMAAMASNENDLLEFVFLFLVVLPWVPETFLARFPVSVKSL